MSQNIKIGVLIKPAGPLLFRGGKPMDATSRVRSELPNPQVLAGALTTLLLRLNGCDLKELSNKTKELRDKKLAPEKLFSDALNSIDSSLIPISKLSFAGPWLSASELIDPLIEPPANMRTLSKGKDENTIECVMLTPHKSATNMPGWRGVCGRKDMLPLWYDGDWDFAKEKSRGVLPVSLLKPLLTGASSVVLPNKKEKDRIYDWFVRSGIVIDSNTMTVDDDAGVLFTQELLEIKDGYGFYAELEGDASLLAAIDSEPHPFPFGGDLRTATIQRVKCFEWPQTEANTGQVFALLTSPAFFSGDNPALPACEGLVAAAVGGNYAISGWDLARGGPKPVRFGVPAGSVFFFDNGIPEQFTKPPASLCANEDARIGWGTYLKGSW